MPEISRWSPTGAPSVNEAKETRILKECQKQRIWHPCQMVMRMVLAFILHRGRMTCSSAAGVIAAESIYRGQLTRFLARSRWQKDDFNEPLRAALLRMEARRGRFLFIVDATMFSQAGKKTRNTYSTGNRQRRPKKGRRYNQKKVCRKKQC